MYLEIMLVSKVEVVSTLHYLEVVVYVSCSRQDFPLVESFLNPNKELLVTTKEYIQ